MLTEDDFEAEEMSYQRLLLAVDDDDDESSRKAFNYACTLARTFDITLGIVSVMETGDMNIYQSLSPDIIKSRRDDIYHDLNTYVGKARAFGVREVKPLIGEGKPERVILEEIIPDFKPDLVLLGSHRRRGHLRIGHVAGAIMREAEVSTIIVK
ncbi:MAG TPA: universal stress protein [Lactobacillus sp.]|jgi:nucleotide-binding universal stress UspA family protein|uniref:Universal stress protein UspA n=1 Tax=Secundilactobacillus silagincola TaxID=1714681 RepID=A0A1Z5J0N2_9LACO|nr:universal stress protein [Secundilactobacillus silagincola]GAX07281.1 universal stress protein UspA [Secundilactobacillus silagincola]HBF75404.1 universal stress protein [Lactobacillus sp.]